VEQSSLAVMCPACWCSPGGLLALMGFREPRPHHSNGIDVPTKRQASLDCIGSTDRAITLHCLSQALVRSSAAYAAAPRLPRPWWRQAASAKVRFSSIGISIGANREGPVSTLSRRSTTPARTILGVRSLTSAPLKRSGYSRFVRRECTDRASPERRRGGARFESRRYRDWRASPWRPRCRRP
jgi:hypothetical protein